MNKAFSLLELSIVLVIIGLIAGGIVAGASMIRAAELRSVITEYQQYQTAVHTFRDKYLGLPGDLKNATAFWGAAHATPATCLTTAGTGTETCDGNGDGELNDPNSPTEYGEPFTFWQHLANAELINGTYTGIAGPGNVNHSILNENVPTSKLSSGAWRAAHTPVSGNASRYEINYQNYLAIGAELSNGWASNPILTPEEAWNIDTKIDDGRPALGKVIARYWNDACAAANDGSHADDDLDADYKLSDDSVQCALYFVKAF